MALEEDPDLIASTYMVADSLSFLRVRGMWWPFLNSTGTKSARAAQTHMQANHLYTRNKIITSKPQNKFQRKQFPSFG